MKRRGFLFGLVAAPLVPAVAKAAPAAAASRGLLIPPQLLPSAAAQRSRSYSEAQLREWFKDCPEVMALNEPPPSWRTDWRYLVEAVADRPMHFSGEAPVGAPNPYAMDDDGWTPWFDRRGVEILRVKCPESTTPSDSCEASRIDLCDSDYAGSDR